MFMIITFIMLLALYNQYYNVYNNIIILCFLSVEFQVFTFKENLCMFSCIEKIYLRIVKKLKYLI